MDTLAPIAVSVTRSEAELSRLPFAVQVVTSEGIGSGRTRLGLDEALAGVPGVIAANRQNYSLDQTLSIRGFGSRSAFGVRGLKVLLDGIPQTLPDGQGQLTNVDLDDVQRVEILRGSSSSLYGNASGGVISLTTEGERPPRIAPSVRVLSGAYGLLKYHGSVDAPVGPGRIAISGVRTINDGFRAHSNADLRQGRARLALPLGTTTLTGIVQVADDPTIKDPGALTRAEMISNPSLANPLSVTRDAGKDVSQSQAGLIASRRFGGGVTANATVFGLKRMLTNPTNAAYIELRRRAYGARGSAALPVSVGSRTAVLTGGADAQWQRDNRINLNFQRTVLTRDQLERVVEVGPFVQASMDPMRSVTLLLGGRYDRVRFSVDDHFLSDGDDSGMRLMSALSGSAGIATHALPAFGPYFNISTSFESPTTTELANRPTGPGGFNPVLDPQKAVSYEVGVRGRAGTAGSTETAGANLRIDYSVALYRANIKGELIPYETPGDPNRRFFRNAGSSRHEGVEVGAGIGAGVFSLRAGYTYSRNRFLEYVVPQLGITPAIVLNGHDEPGVPRHYVRGVLTFRPAGFGWVALEETAASSFFVDDANATRNNGWASTAVRGGLEIRAAGWSIGPFGGVSNLFDKHYAASVQVNAANGRYFEPSPGRNGYVGVEIAPSER
jgi:iron complex outermembrane receptor protein